MFREDPGIIILLGIFEKEMRSMLTLFTVICVGLIAYLVMTKKQPGTTGAPAPAPTATTPTTSIASAKTESPLSASLWQRLGFVDNTPNIIWAVVAGHEERGPIIRFVMNEDNGVWYDPGKKLLVPLEARIPYEDESPLEAFFRGVFGKRWYGYPFINAIKPLTIDRVTFSPTKLAKVTVEEQLEATTVHRYGLYRVFIRPTFHRNVDAKNGIRFNFISTATIKVVDPWPIFSEYTSNFLPQISNTISAFVSERVLDIGWDLYKENSTKENFPIDKLNECLTKFGIEVVQFEANEPELHPSIQASQEEAAKAEQTAIAAERTGEAAARVTERQALADATKITLAGNANAEALERMNKAKADRLNQLIEVYIKKGMPPDEALRTATELVRREFEADAVGELTTYAPGSSGIILGSGDKK